MPLTPMRETFTLRKFVGSELYGPTYSDHLLQPCRFVRATKLIKKTDGAEVISSAFLRTSSEVASNDLILYGTNTYQIASVNEITGIGNSVIEKEVRLSGETPTAGTIEVTDMLKSVYDTDANGVVDKAECISLAVTAGTGGISAFQVVIIDPDTQKSIPADGTNTTHAGIVAGMASSAISENASGQIVYTGDITNPAWSLVPGSAYYLSVAGSISQIPPTSGFWQQIGIAKSSTVLLIRLREPIVVI
jgi:hypothetical protein